MFALGLRYLMGWAMAASDGQEKQRTEWPPHPDRIFMALAAAWFETGQDPMQGAALRWMEALPPPDVSASDASDRCSGRQKGPVVSYVPVNDSGLGTKIPDTGDLRKLKEAGLDVLLEYRSRQPRSFPVAIPESPDVFLIWPEADAGEHLAALQALAREVTHVGHSASLVQMWVEPAPPEATWQPSNGVAAQRMRVSYQGRLDSLKDRMNYDAYVTWRDLQAAIRKARDDRKKLPDKAERKEAAATLKALEAEFAQLGDTEPLTQRPDTGRWQGYARTAEHLPEPPSLSMFDANLLVVALRGRRYPLVSTLRFTEALRGALLKSCPHPVPEWLSGHQPGTDLPTREPHLALIPLPFVGRPHADGHLMGMALVLPRGLAPGDTARCLNPLFWNPDTGAPRSFKLFDGQWLEAEAEIELRSTPPYNLQNKTWTGASRVWASVTPVVLDRHFKGTDKWDQAADCLKQACERIGLPRPETVLLNPVSSVEGVPHARKFSPLTRKRDGGSMEHTHAILIFAAPVKGPVIVGAGRFRGYGLCRPMDRENGHA
jgi:CRISPR-associated protein Csb2